MRTAWLLLLALPVLVAGEVRPDPGARRAVWPFSVPTAEVLRALPRKVFAHYHTQFPASHDDLPPDQDYYALHYLTPGGEGGKHRAYGGWLRDRPLGRDPIGPGYEDADLRWEVQAAAALGLDGFCVNLLASQGTHFLRARALIRAAAGEGRGFTVALMPDLHGEFARHPERLAVAVAALADEPGLHRLPDGRILLMAFDAQLQAPSWWRDQLGQLEAAGIRCAFLPCVQQVERHRDGLLALPQAVGIGDWGVRSVAEVAGLEDHAAAAHAAGKWWMAPVAPQDYRPKSLWAQEAGGADLFRAMWRQAIARKADLVQLVTWNDYSEHTHIAPSPGTGWVFYDLTAYHLAWFKTGVEPTVRRDALYLLHRRMPLAIGPADRRARLTPAGRGEDKVQALAFATAPARLQVASASAAVPVVAEVPVGLSALDAPLQPGRPWCRLEREGQEPLQFDSAFPVSVEAVEQDLLYRGSGGGR